MTPTRRPELILAILRHQEELLKAQIEERNFNGSGLLLVKILSCDLWLSRYKETSGRCYIELPFKTKGVINVKSDDRKCFLWSLLAAKFHPANHANDESTYKAYVMEIKIKDGVVKKEKNSQDRKRE
jgi:hypothetical protein